MVRRAGTPLLFSTIGIYLARYGQKDQPNTYVVETQHRSGARNRVVTFSDSGPSPPPNRELMALHRSLAKVFHASGMLPTYDNLR